MDPGHQVKTINPTDAQRRHLWRLFFALQFSIDLTYSIRPSLDSQADSEGSIPLTRPNLFKGFKLVCVSPSAFGDSLRDACSYESEALPPRPRTPD